MIRVIVPIMAVFISIMIYMQVVIDLDLMYSGDGSLAFSLQSMRCEIKKAKITFLMWKIMWRCWTKSALFMLFVDNMLLKGVCEKHSASDFKTDHELSSLHRRRRGALSFIMALVLLSQSLSIWSSLHLWSSSSSPAFEGDASRDARLFVQLWWTS